jgi:hypothetical protein
VAKADATVPQIQVETIKAQVVDARGRVQFEETRCDIGRLWPPRTERVS